jgi:hypothetical protein
MFAVVGGNNANIVHGFVEQRHISLVLNDLYRIQPAWLVERSRNAGEMTTRLGILVSPPNPVLSLRFGRRRIFVRPSSASGAAAPSAALRRKIRSVQRADEQALKSAGALHPQALQVGVSVRQSAYSRLGLPQ